jgi:squalene-hopene/tetraprenyl-beta-curcumene cyclase
MNLPIDVERVLLAHKAVRAELLAERSHEGHWVGQLAGSPPATAAAISALVAAHRRQTGQTLRENLAGDSQAIEQLVQGDLSELLLESVHWLARHQNADGGWGDCLGARSNLAATMLVQAAFRMTGVPAKYADLIVRADQYIAQEGGASRLRRDESIDKTFVAAVLANCALAGIIRWGKVPTLPFEWVSLPTSWTKHLQVPYPRYDMPLLVAIGKAKFHHKPPRNPLIWLVRRSVRAKSLAVLSSLQAADDSFLASPLVTAFVVTSLAGIGCQDHAIVQRGIEFLLSTVRGDASWAIHTNFALTNTALALDSLAVDRGGVPRLAHPERREGDERRETRRAAVSRGADWQDTAQTTDTVEEFALPDDQTNAEGSGEQAAEMESVFPERCLAWLVDSQRTAADAVTHVSPGGWAWSDAPGALPNTISTAAALVALAHWVRAHRDADERIDRAVRLGIGWLLAVQHDEGGWPTFYADDSDLRLDESGPDATAQALSALAAWRRLGAPAEYAARLGRSIERGWRYLESRQGADGRFVPLWFGNEHQSGDHNPVFGTAQVLVACAELQRLESELAQRAARWLVSAQHSTGGWGPPRAPRDYSGTEKDGFRAWRANEAMAKLCSVEETALAISALLPMAESIVGAAPAVSAGLTWLAASVEQDAHRRPAVIGFSLSKIWYHERLYPLVLAAGAFSRASRLLAPQPHAAAPVGSR